MIKVLFGSFLWQYLSILYLHNIIFIFKQIFYKPTSTVLSHRQHARSHKITTWNLYKKGKKVNWIYYFRGMASLNCLFSNFTSQQLWLSTFLLRFHSACYSAAQSLTVTYIIGAVWKPLRTDFVRWPMLELCWELIPSQSVLCPLSMPHLAPRLHRHCWISQDFEGKILFLL